MIYRIICSNIAYPSNRIPGRLMGAWVAGVDGFNLNYPDISEPRARFYFTENGWCKVGRFVAVNARREDRVVRVIRRKNPHKSQIVYKDELQVAILPRKVKTNRRKKNF
jgi:hypothetical protein